MVRKEKEVAREQENERERGKGEPEWRSAKERRGEEGGGVVVA